CSWWPPGSFFLFYVIISVSDDRGYQRLGRPPEAVAKRAAAILDGGVRNHSGDSGSNLDSDSGASPAARANDQEQSPGQPPGPER
ncbi:MAG TPA: hypothetical protein VKB57_03690, partial [Acidimicrobiales bacterium]|nr:hypothetical protein [Acidimicrobiales bacterium]